jgi:hypothetical protein
MDNFVSNLSLIEQVVVLLTVIASLLIYLFKERCVGLLGEIKDSISNVLFKNKIEQRILSLHDHDMFGVIEQVRLECKHTKFYTHKKFDATKSEMFVDFMNFKLDSIAKGFGDLIDRTNSIENNTELKREIGRTMGRIITEYTEQTRIHFYKKGIPVKDADDAVNTFEKWRMDTVQAVESRVGSIFSSNFHRTKYENLLAVLEVISMAISLIPKDGVGAFNAINGKFKDLKY